MHKEILWNYVNNHRKQVLSFPKPLHNPKREKSGSKQNCRREHCGRQFISEHGRTCRGTLSWIKNAINIMLVRGTGIRDISVVPQISIARVLKVLKSGGYQIQPKKSHYDCLETGVFWAYVRKKGKKKNTVRLIYVYHRGSGEIVYAWGKRDL
jgi:hypothetical protein